MLLKSINPLIPSFFCIDLSHKTKLINNKDVKIFNADFKASIPSLLDEIMKGYTTFPKALGGVLVV